MKKYFAWFFFVSGDVGLIKMALALMGGTPTNMGVVELWVGWLTAFFVNALCFYLWWRWK